MKLILKKPVPSLGEPGEVVSVKPGYARNYLLPQGLAYEASEANLKRIEAERREEEERARRDFLEGRRRVSRLEGTVLDFMARASEEGKLFGSISANDIEEKINGLGFDFELERRQILLDEPLKEVGSHTVAIRFHNEVETEIEVRIAREED